MRASAGPTPPRAAVLLRGINVGGNNRVPMADLKLLLAELGCTGAVTYLQSGNAVVVPPAALARAKGAAGWVELRSAVERALHSRFGLELKVRITDLVELDAVIAGNPFGRAVDEPKQVHAVFLEGVPDQAAVDRLRAATVAPNECVVSGAVAYLHYPIGFHAKPVPIERALAMWATARNWRTVLEVRALLAA